MFIFSVNENTQREVGGAPRCGVLGRRGASSKAVEEGTTWGVEKGIFMGRDSSDDGRLVTDKGTGQISKHITADRSQGLVRRVGDVERDKMGVHPGCWVALEEDVCPLALSPERVCNIPTAKAHPVPSDTSPPTTGVPNPRATDRYQSVAC